MGCAKTKIALEPVVVEVCPHKASVDRAEPHNAIALESASWTAGISGRHRSTQDCGGQIYVKKKVGDETQSGKVAEKKHAESLGDMEWQGENKWRVNALSELFRFEPSPPPATTQSVPLPFMAPPPDAATDESATSKVIITSPFDSSIKFVVDEPGKKVYGVDAFSLADQDVQPEETIWFEKRLFMKDFKCVKSLDERAIKAPAELRLGNPRNIVNYLTKPAKNDFQKFRVLFRWVALTINYECNFMNSDVPRENVPSAVLALGSADCYGYSVLYQFLCSLAGLTCEVIAGFNKNVIPGKPPLGHTWNRIKIDGRWYLADCTAASHTSASSCVPEKFREYEFLSEPRYFNARRLPKNLNRYGGPVPYKSLWQFHCQPTFGALASVCDLECLSPHTGVIQADKDNHVEIVMRTTLPVLVWTTLTTSRDLWDHRENSVQWWDGDELHCAIDLPHDGVWEFKVFGQLLCDKDKIRHPNSLIPPTVIDSGHCHLVTFALVGKEGKMNPPNLAHDTGMCGILLTCTDIFPVSQASPFVKAENGKAAIAFLVRDRGVKVVYRFFNVNNHHRLINKHVYMERVGNIVIAHIFCPTPGRYGFRLLVNKIGKEYSRQGEYIIDHESTEDGDEPMTFSQTLGYHIWGPNEQMEDLGLKVTSGHTSSTIIAAEGEVIFQLSWPISEKLVLSCALQDIDKEVRIQAGRVLIHTSRVSDSLACTTFHVRMKETGCFVLQVYARQKNSTINRRVGGWLMVVKKKSPKPRFPDECIICGPNDAFHKLGMKTKVSKLETGDGRGRIDISYDADEERAFRYEVTSSSHNKYEEVVNVTTSAIRQTSFFVTTFSFLMPVPNVYAIRIMTVGESFEWISIGTWIVIYDASIASLHQMAGRQSICN